MYLKSMILDGFKSYGNRTEIHGFDPLFNAITGLNGSGKSNILDAICFVLGISNLSQVRAINLQDLVFKGGKAGITKASVTLVFDNQNPKQSPIGYEQHKEITVTRQVVMGGKNKYLINGSNVQNKRVLDMFCSVQLNVNNPHFLIMQGRITKVLNMKPPEILAMIEEAAGTRMYECKKQSSQKTIEKKDAKLKELNTVIREEISPKLQKLQEEKAQYLEYQNVMRELEYVTKIYVSWCYDNAKQNVEQSNSKKEKVYARMKEIEQKEKNEEKEQKDLDEEIAKLQAQKDAEGGGRLLTLEKELKEKEKIEAKAVAAQKACQDSIVSEQKKLKQLEKSLKEDEASLAAKEAELKKVEGIFQKLKDTEQTDSEALAAAQRKYQAVSAGLVGDDDGENATLQDQLMAAKQEIAQAQTEVKQSEMQLQHFQKELKEKQDEMKATASEYQKDSRNLENMEKEVTTLQGHLSKINYQQGQIERLQEERKTLTAETRVLREKVNTFEARYPTLNFQYRKPEPNFNDTSVKGLVCKLFKMRDKAMAVALETAGGGRLYNVVVDTEMTAKKLLQKGQLQYRTTIIPLNKIAGHSIDQNTVRLAQQLVGKENVYPALSLIEYDPQVHAAMQWVFGQVFICRDMEIAKRVTYNDRILKKCVTLDGDVCDPSGTLSGGARQKGVALLDQLEEYVTAQDALRRKEQRLFEIDAEIRNLSKTAERFQQLKQQLELKSHEVELVRLRLQQTTHHQHKEEVEALQAKIDDLKEKLKQNKAVQETHNKKVKEIEYKLKNSKQLQEQAIKEAENEMNRLKKKSEESRKQWKQREQEFETLKLEIKELNTSITTGHEQIKATQENIEQLKAKIEEMKTEVAEAKYAVQQVQKDLQAQKGSINMISKEIQQRIQRKEKIVKESGEAALEHKKLEHEITRIEQDAKENQAQITALEQKYNWLVDKYNNLRNTDYDFNSVNPKELGKRKAKLEEMSEKLGRNLNTKAMNLLGKEEEHYSDLLRKKKIVENDKAKLMAVIQELDRKKEDALRKAWEQVNKDFGSIFSTLLTGAEARLAPPEGMDVQDGLEVKVGFSGIWKESLGELSGGQRSLVALSLILAMLLFKPAPIYILDEVDAALDLSHTQNIGNMLKTHFKHSQFIIVSLKDGMFNNANVLFRTKFVDGMSTVTRTVQRQK